MSASASADRAAWLAELRLDEAPQLVAALDALLRSVGRQTGAQAAALELDNGSGAGSPARRVVHWPDGGRTHRCPSRSANSPSAACSSGARAALATRPWPMPHGSASALLDARLREMRPCTQPGARADGRRRRQRLAVGDRCRRLLTWVSDSVEQHTGWPVSREIGTHSSRFVRPPPGLRSRASWNRYRADREAHRPFRDASPSATPRTAPCWSR